MGVEAGKMVAGSKEGGGGRMVVVVVVVVVVLRSKEGVRVTITYLTRHRHQIDSAI